MFVYLQRGYTQFKPHFMVQKCLDSSNSQTCRDNCVNNGRYCAMDSIPQGLQSSYNGRQVHMGDCKTCKAMCMLHTILTSKNSMAPQHLCLPCRLLRRISGSFASGNKLSPSIKHGCGGHMFSCLTRTASKTVVAGPYSLIPNLQIWFLNANWTYEA